MISGSNMMAGQPRINFFILLLVLGAGLIIIYNFNPVDGASYYPKCPSFWLTGLYCPGCGITRALHQLLHGNIRAALAYNPLAIIVSPLVIWMMFKPHWIYHSMTPKIAFVVLVAYGILRNIPYYPFLLLAPHAI